MVGVDVVVVAGVVELVAEDDDMVAIDIADVEDIIGAVVVVVVVAGLISVW